MNACNSKRSWSNIVVAIILVLGIIASSIIAVNGVIMIKASKTNILVTGSAKQKVTSDLVIWTGNFSAQDSDIVDAYDKLKVSRIKVSVFLKNQKLARDEFEFSHINRTYSRTSRKYIVSQVVTIRSNDTEKITEISKDSIKLLKKNVAFESHPPKYFYTKLPELKDDLIAEATEEAKKHGEIMAVNAGNKLGDLKFAEIHNIQITPLNSNEIMNTGIIDSSSLEKEVTVDVYCAFKVKNK